MITEEEIIQLWKERAREEVEENKQFLHSLQGKNTDRRVAELNDEVFKELDCLQCANCCKTTPALVTRSDVKRIAKSLGMPPKTFIRKYLIEDIDGSLMTNGVPCTFLNRDNSCAIYEVRPEACRAYPHMNDFRFTGRARLNTENTLVCPAVYYVVSTLKKEEN